MLRNYLIITFRSLIRNRLFSIINIGGLTIAIGMVVLILSWIQFELSFDKFHKNAENIYRIIQEDHLPNGETDYYSITPSPLGPFLENTMPEVLSATRVMYRNWNLKVTEPHMSGQHRIIEQRGILADPSFMNIFSFTLISGDKQTVFKDKNEIIIAKSLAEELFGNREVIGNTILIDDNLELTVSGVIEDVPYNSHLRFDFIAPFSLLLDLQNYNISDWGTNNHYTYVLLNENTENKAFAEKIKYVIKEHVPDSPSIQKLHPLLKIHLYNPRGGGIISMIYIVSVLAIVILLIACVNYMNLSSARFSKRAKEISIRKTSGASKSQLIIQFLSESIIIALIAANFGLLLASLLKPIFNQTFNSYININYSSQNILVLFAVITITGLLAGVYPAFFLSSFNTQNVLKGNSNVRSSGIIFRKALVIFQFTISTILIFGTIVLFRQYSLLLNKDLGFTQENIICLRLTNQVKQHMNVLKENLLENPDIQSVSMTNTSLDLWETAGGANDFKWEGQAADEYLPLTGVMSSDESFINMFDIELINGRNFSISETSDHEKEFLVNEAAIKAMGLEDPIGRKIKIFDYEGVIIGVIKDFHYSSGRYMVFPLVIGNLIGWQDVINIKINAENIPETIQFIKDEFNQIGAGSIFNYQFLDDRITQLYNYEKGYSGILRKTAILAILISSMGLFGLASFLIEQRTKEIGIRKISGATTLKILIKLLKGFTNWVLISFIISFPISWYLMKNWLQNYSFKAELSWWLFTLVGLLILIISWLTIFYQTYKAAIKNPVEALRYE